MKDKSAVFECPITIKEHHLDSFGHVNNAVYLELFEEARWELITNRGYGLAEIHRLKMGPVILDVSLQFKKELRNRETIIVRSTCFDYKGKIGKIQQTMINAKGEEACTALFTFGLFDLKSRKLVEPTPEWLMAVGLSE